MWLALELKSRGIGNIFKCILRDQYTRMRLRAGVSVSILLWIGLAVVLIALVSYWMFGSTADELLKIDSPNEDQIRRIATQLLVNDNYKKRDEAVKKLVKLGQAAVPVLKDVCLSDPDPNVRWSSLRVLMGMDVDTTAEVLVKLIVDPDVEVRRAAANTATRLQHKIAESILITALSDEDAQVITTAMDGCEMRKKSMRKAVPKLMAALKHSDRFVQQRAVRVLKVITGRNFEDRIGTATQ